MRQGDRHEQMPIGNLGAVLREQGQDREDRQEKRVNHPPIRVFLVSPAQQVENPPVWHDRSGFLDEKVVAEAFFKVCLIV